MKFALYAFTALLSILSADNAPSSDDAFQITIKKHEANLKKVAEIFDGHKVTLTTVKDAKTTKIYTCPNFDKCPVIAELKPGTKLNATEGKVEQNGFMIHLWFKTEFEGKEAWVGSWLISPMMLEDKNGKPFASILGMDGIVNSTQNTTPIIIHVLCDSDNPELVQRVQERFQALCHAKQVLIYKNKKDYSPK